MLKTDGVVSCDDNNVSVSLDVSFDVYQYHDVIVSCNNDSDTIIFYDGDDFNVSYDVYHDVIDFLKMMTIMLLFPMVDDIDVIVSCDNDDD